MKSVLRIYAVPPSVINYIRTRPLEIEELLNCNDTRITIEIQDKDEIERYQLFIDSKKSLEEVSNFYSINSRFWNASIFPAPSMGFEQIQPNDKESLEALGVIPGSTIIYSRKRNRPSAKR